MSVLDDYQQASDRRLNGLRRVLPLPLRKLTVQLFGQRTSIHRSCRFTVPPVWLAATYRPAAM